MTIKVVNYSSASSLTLGVLYDESVILLKGSSACTLILPNPALMLGSSYMFTIVAVTPYVEFVIDASTNGGTMSFQGDSSEMFTNVTTAISASSEAEGSITLISDGSTWHGMCPAPRWIGI